MTALAMIRCSDGIVLATDGAGYDPKTGRLASTMPKVALLPDLTCVLASQGAGMVVELAQISLRAKAASGQALDCFDDVLDALPDILRSLAVHDIPETTDDPDFAMLVGGYSTARGRWETYAIHNAAAMKVHGPDEGGEPFRLYPTPTAWFCPLPPAELCERVGLDLAVVEAGAPNPTDAAVRAICAARLMKEVVIPGRAEPVHAVGCFIQLTTLSRGMIQSGIVHRWPDVRGEFVAPQGNDLPPFLTAATSPTPN